MELHLPTACVNRYKSASQRARVGTESWGAENFFCPVCDSPRLQLAPQGTATLDYTCPKCASPFQLKSQSKQFGAKIVDSAYSKMREAVLTDRTPNLYVLHYDLTAWAVRTVILIPHFAFALSAIEPRKPLAATARRAGWVGCNILLSQIPQDARIPIVGNGTARPAVEVRRAYQRLRPLAKLKADTRGWTLDVLKVVRGLGEEDAGVNAGRGLGEEDAGVNAGRGLGEEDSGVNPALRKTFSLGDVYAHEDALAKLHPGNRHVRDKVRQQLQVLRDMGLIEFLGDGEYRFN